MDFAPLQLCAVLVALVLVNGWAARRLRVPADRAQTPARTPMLGAVTALSIVAAIYAMLTIRSEDGFLLVVLIAPVQLVALAVRFFRYNRYRGRPVSWRRLVFGNLLLLVIPLTGLLAAGELWFRFGCDTTDSIGYTKVARRWLQRHYAFNNFGYRDDVDYQLARSDRAHRISFVGDSFTAGHGIADVDQRVANRLRRLNPDWEVHVLARNGHDTEVELQELTVATSNGYVVDEVVLVYCLNDVMDLLPHWQETLKVAAQQAEGRLAIFDSSYLLDTAYYRITIARVPGVSDYFSFVGEAYRGEVWERQAARLRAFRQVVEKAGGRLSVITWPFLNALGPAYPHQAIHDRLDRFWAAEAVPHLDLLTELTPHTAEGLVVNSHDAHPNEHASELATTVINRWLHQVIDAPRPKGH